MLLLILCIVVNALIGVVFKLFDTYKIHTLPAIVVNYYVCVLTSIAVTGSMTITSDTISEPYLPYAMGLGLCFILVFDVVARTVGSFGIVVASIFQKMSLIAPTIVAIVFFGEVLSWPKGVGILSAVASIFLITGIMTKGVKGQHTWGDWILPIITLIGSSVIDVSLFMIQRHAIADSADIGFIATLFGTAALTGTILLGYKVLRGQQKVALRDITGGVLLGVPNFFSIYLLLALLSDGWDGSQIFPINNVGILALSALIGFVFFKEALTKYRIAGVVLSILAIFMIANG